MLHRPTLVILLALASIGSALTAQAPAKRPIQSSDLFRLRAIGDPQRSPDGAWVAGTVTRADSAKDKSDTDIWLSRWDGTATVYQTLKSNRVDTELIVYPGETHGIRRPSFQKDRLDRYVKVVCQVSNRGAGAVAPHTVRSRTATIIPLSGCASDLPASPGWWGPGSPPPR